MTVLAVGAVLAVGLTIEGLATDENEFIYYAKWLDIIEFDLHCRWVPYESNYIKGTVENTTPWPAEITTVYGMETPWNGTKTFALKPHEEKEFTIDYPCDAGRHGGVWGQIAIQVINAKLLNVTSTESFDMYNKMRNSEIEVEIQSNTITKLRTHLQALPTEFYGTINTNNGTAAGIEVIVVNVANHTDVKRDIANSEGEYFIRTPSGGYLIQAIGGGPESYHYVTLEPPNETYHWPPITGLNEINLNYD